MQRSAASTSASREIDAPRNRGADARLVVRGVYDSATARNVPADQLPHALDRGRVQRGEGLVENPQRRPLAEREPRQRDSPPLPLRQHARGQVLAPREAEAVEGGGHLPLAGGRSRERGGDAEIFRCGQVVLEGVGVAQVEQANPELLLEPA